MKVQQEHGSLNDTQLAWTI